LVLADHRSITKISVAKDFGLGKRGSAHRKSLIANC